MAYVATYLNFLGKTEEAFNFYKSVFKTEFHGGIARMGDFPPPPGAPELSEEDKQKIMHIELPITAGHLLMATDAMDSMGHTIVVGNNTTIFLNYDSKSEADEIFTALSEGSSETTPMADMPWGSYWGTFLDRFGIRWMINAPLT